MLDQILAITNKNEWFDSPCAREIRRLIEEAHPATLDIGAMSNELRKRAYQLRNTQMLADDGELLLTLARIVEGMPVEKAFGAPGDWGYEHPIGRALYKGGR